MSNPNQKQTLRQQMRKQRQSLQAENMAPNLTRALAALLQAQPALDTVAGFAPIGHEINIWPLLHSLHAKGKIVALPVLTKRGLPLLFRQWSPRCDMATDQYGIAYPSKGVEIVPQIILVPLLAFTSAGDRLGYGGGYYDRTLAHLRSQGEVFACGVAYAGQEVTALPTAPHDEPLDGIITENGFRTFT